MSLKTKILRSFGQFNQVTARARQHFTSALMSRCYTALPFLFEGVLGRAAPGAGSQMVHAQDHGRYGGRPLPRNLVWGGDIGWGDVSTNSRVAMYYQNVTGGDVGTWISFAKGLSSPLDSLPWMFEGYVSPGIDTATGNAVGGSAMALEAHLIVVVNQPVSLDDVDFRIKNVTTGAEQILSSQYSSIQTVTPGLSSSDHYYDLEFTDVPCIEDEWNRFEVKLNAHVTSHAWLEFAASAETRNRSEPDSDGSNQLRNLTF